MVLGMMQRDGDVMTKVAPNTRAIQPEIVENVKQGMPFILMNGMPSRNLIKRGIPTIPLTTGPGNL